MKNLKEKLKKLSEWKSVILVVIISVGLFYWFQLRPMLIKRQCSWFTQLEKGNPAVPAFAGVTKEEAEKKTNQWKIDNNCKNAKTKTEIFTCQIKTEEQASRIAQPAELDKLVTKEATKAQYDACLRHHGL